MNTSLRGALLLAPVLSLTPAVLRSPVVHAPARGLCDDPGDARLMTLDGVERRFGALLGDGVPGDGVQGDGVLVVAYTGVGCPISGKYAPRLQALHERYAARGVRFVGVNANSQDSRAEVAEECRELGVEFPVLKDFRQELTRALDARTTTETFVFDAEGTLVYRGAVDDQYEVGAARPEPGSTYLVDALEATLSGRAPEVAETEAPGCRITVLDPAELPEPVTWSGDVASILQRRCMTCHRKGQVGPFSLETYDKARGWSEMIGEVVDEGRMPPWNADHRFDGVFANERRLTRPEKEKLLQWVADGAPRGNPDEEPPAVDWPEGWRIGEPDVVFEMERRLRGPELPAEGFAVPREGVVDYQYFTAETNFTEDRWVQALEVRPGAAEVVHHVLILLQDPSSGERTDFRSYLAVAVPGDTPSIYPEGYGKRIPKGARLIFQLHYTPNGKERFDRSSLAMKFCEEPPIFEVVTDAVVNDRFRIPPGAENHEVTGSRTLREDTGLVGFFPHMHTRGKDFRYVLHRVDGTSEELLYSHYDFNWQESYLLPDPLPVMAGARIECVGHFDNSENNPNNPDPEAWVTWGEQTYEEMFIGYFDYVRPVDEF